MGEKESPQALLTTPNQEDTFLALFVRVRLAQVAQSVEQRIENPRVGGSIPSLGTSIYIKLKSGVYEKTDF